MHPLVGCPDSGRTSRLSSRATPMWFQRVRSLLVRGHHNRGIVRKVVELPEPLHFLTEFRILADLSSFRRPEGDLLVGGTFLRY